jgi:hypothetical protein
MSTEYEYPIVIGILAAIIIFGIYWESRPNRNSAVEDKKLQQPERRKPRRLEFYGVAALATVGGALICVVASFLDFDRIDAIIILLCVSFCVLLVAQSRLEEVVVQLREAVRDLRDSIDHR